MNVNSIVVGDFDSYAGLTFNTFSLDAQAVSTLGFKAVGLDADEWISLIEVSGSILSSLHPTNFSSPVFLLSLLVVAQIRGH